ncbi:MAG: MGMT family protein [Candidatus Bathyarchaeota archaeon]|jgi:O-6-methylguanine DNA methyltransferase
MNQYYGFRAKRGIRVIHIYCEETDEMWFAAAIENESILATSSARNEKDALKYILHDVPYNASFQMAEDHTQFSKKVMSAMQSIFDGDGTSSKFKLEMKHLSDYAQKVLKCVSLVPVGYVTTYGAVAKAIGGSPRAVGRVMATNPFPPLVPCHRVVRSDFTLGGFGGGVGMKWVMLQRENKGHSESMQIRVDGKSLSLFPINFLGKG